MSEAMREILNFARNDMENKYINACIYPDNHASINLAKNKGLFLPGK